MAHPFFVILEREPDFLTLVGSVFSLHKHRLRTLGGQSLSELAGISGPQTTFYGGSVSIQIVSSLSLVHYIQGMIG